MATLAKHGVILLFSCQDARVCCTRTEGKLPRRGLICIDAVANPPTIPERDYRTSHIQTVHIIYIICIMRSIETLWAMHRTAQTAEIYDPGVLVVRHRHTLSTRTNCPVVTGAPDGAIPLPRVRPGVFAIRSSIARSPTPCRRTCVLSREFSDTRSLTRLRSDASMPPYLDFHC